jgi:hypothetical protein
LLFELVGVRLDVKLHLLGQLPVDALGVAYVVKSV